MLTILQGDDTAANSREIKMKMPNADIGDGWQIGFSLCGATRIADYVAGGVLAFNFSREETMTFPLGISYARTYLSKGGLEMTVSNMVPVCVTDCVARVAGANNSVDLSISVTSPIPKVAVDALTKDSTTGDVKALANALLTAINAAAEK